MFVSSTAAQQRLCSIGCRIPTPAASRVPAALLVVSELAPDPAVGADAFAPAVAAVAPDAVMLADAGAPAVLAFAPAAAMLAQPQAARGPRCSQTFTKPVPARPAGLSKLT